MTPRGIQLSNHTDPAHCTCYWKWTWKWKWICFLFAKKWRNHQIYGILPSDYYFHNSHIIFILNLHLFSVLRRRVNFQLNSMQRLNEWVLVMSYIFYPPSFKNFPEMWVTWQLNTRSSVGQCRHNNVVVTGQPSVLDMYTNTLTLRIQQKKTHLNYSEMIAKLVLSLINKTEQHSVLTLYISLYW